MKKRILISCMLLALVMMLVCVMAFAASAAGETASSICPVSGGSHRVERQASCMSDVKCEDCKEVVTPALGHSWDGKQNCVTDEKCIRCLTVNPDKLRTGNHIPDREEPDCLNPVRCTVCPGLIVRDGVALKALGHDESAADPTCGAGKVCSRCHFVLEDATWEHTVDWTAATVVRKPTAERPGILRATCSVCGETVEKSDKYVAPVEDPIDGGEEKNGLPTGALIGIIAGGVVVVGGGATATILVLKKKKKGASAE